MTTEHIKVFTGSSIIVNGLKNLLDSKNISYIVKDKFESARLGGFGEQIESVEVLVLKPDLEKAKLIIDSYKEEINA